MSNVDELKAKLNKIKGNWIKCDKNGTGGVGLTIEEILGVETNNLEYPDYNGIELKTKKNSKRKYFTLFNATPDNNLFEIKRIFKEYSYPSKNPKYNSLNLSVYADMMRSTETNKFKLYIDDKKRVIFLKVYSEKGKIIEKQISWSFEMIEDKFLRKFNIFCLINYDIKKTSSRKFFKITKFEIYKITNFNNFLKLLRKGQVRISFKLGQFEKGKRKGDIHDHGTSFELNSNYVNDLFDKCN